ncbi:MAG: hypothetical protein GY866_37305 [Proteobacteria bacterium]|nr:hypothetical protein [Pseudomonadota bacterium]
MYPIRLFHHKVTISFTVLIIAFCLLVTTGAAKEPANNREKFNRIPELIKLIQRARDAGMSDEDLKNLELRDGDKTFNVNDYIEDSKRIERTKDDKLKRFLSKKFLTVNDIFKELIVSEPGVIKKLREELVSER